MPRFLLHVSAMACMLSVSTLPSALSSQESAPVGRPYGAFAFTDSVLIPLPPGEAFDRFLEVDAWWDHRVSENPIRFYIDAKPGGGFFEIFDETGDGVRHAEVIFASRGKTLRMRGPLGLSGYALDMVYTLEFRAEGPGTHVRLDVRGAGELEEGWAETVQRVWNHFLTERFKP